MALFKISKGSKNNLPTTLTEGYCWYTFEDSKFYIDFKDENGVLIRKALSAENAETLCGISLDELKAELTNQDTVILAEAQTYTDNALAEIKETGGLKGDDGISATHSWNGTTLTITSASGTSSADLKGDKGDQGIQGEQGIQGIQGKQGEKGADGAKGDAGYSPVRGTDYWTDADKAEIKSYVDEAILNGAW